MVTPIFEFSGKYRFLSNFWPAEVSYLEVVYWTVENAYQAAKCALHTDRLNFVGMTPVEAKRAGRKVCIRSDWDQVRLSVMEDLVTQKFRNHNHLRTLLVDTGTAEIFEGNTWGDLFWGVNRSTLRGSNHLGVILMKVREELKSW